MSDILSLLDAEQVQVEDACSLLIDLLHLLHTVAVAAVTYVEPRPLQVSTLCRLAPAQVADAVEAAIRSLVLLRDTCRSLGCATIREHQHTLRQIHDLHTLVQQTITTLETEACRFAPERSFPCP